MRKNHCDGDIFESLKLCSNITLSQWFFFVISKPELTWNHFHEWLSPIVLTQLVPNECKIDDRQVLQKYQHLWQHDILCTKAPPFYNLKTQQKTFQIKKVKTQKLKFQSKSFSYFKFSVLHGLKAEIKKIVTSSQTRRE